MVNVTNSTNIYVRLFTLELFFAIRFSFVGWFVTYFTNKFSV